MTRTSENEAQRTYILTLNVTAVDTNVEAASPGMAQNKETLVFKLVSDGELLTEIGREEAGLAEKLEDAIRRLSDVDNKLRSMVAKFNTLNTPEAFQAEQSRANEVNEQMSKSKDVTAEVFTDYSRILLEFRVNRLPEHLIKDMEQKVVSKLADVLQNDFPQTEEAYGKLHGELAAARKPEAEAAFAVQNKVTVLLAKLCDIRNGIGQGLDHKKLITELENLLKGRYSQKVLYDYLKESGTEDLKRIVIKPPTTPVGITAGQKATVRVPVKIGQAYNGTFTLAMEPSTGSDLKVVEKIVLKEEDEDFTLEITAGFNKGNHSIRITPDKGLAVDLKVVVK